VARGDRKRYTQVVPPEAVGRRLAWEKKLVLTDQYAPVDNFMAPVFHNR
jgi:hypothetical protein